MIRRAISGLKGKQTTETRLEDAEQQTAGIDGMRARGILRSGVRRLWLFHRGTGGGVEVPLEFAIEGGESING